MPPPRDAPWLENCLAKMMVFPRGWYDDQVDSTAQALAWFANLGPGDSWVQFALQRLEEIEQVADNGQPGPTPPRRLVETKTR